MPSISSVLSAKLNTPATRITMDYYRNAEATKPSATVTLADLIEGIRGDDFAQQVAAARNEMGNGDRKSADALKRKLPAVSISGCVTAGPRKQAAEQGRFEHNGLLQIDLDAKDNGGFLLADMVEILRGDPHIVAGFVTPSGAGVKGIARIPADTATHKAAFHAAEAHFLALGLRIDRACKDTGRLCFVSHDPDAWLHTRPAVEFSPKPEDEPGDADESDESEEAAPPRARYQISESGGLVIRGGGGHGGRDLTLDDLREMLAVIPPKMEYQEWMRLVSAAFAEFGEAAKPALEAWSPCGKSGELDYKFVHRLETVKIGTLIMIAREHGWIPGAPTSAAAPPPPHAVPHAQPANGGDPSPTTQPGPARPKGAHAIPAIIFPVPGGDVTHDLAAHHIFSAIGPTRRLFMRGCVVHEVAVASNGDFELTPVAPERFCSVVETFGPRVARKEIDDGKVSWRPTLFPVATAKVSMASDAARVCLPPVRQLVAASVLVPNGPGAAATLSKGWHAHAGGTFISHGGETPAMDAQEAVALLLGVLQDFDFPSGGDAARAVASMLGPAMKIGGWITGDFPLDIAEADQSQAGKTYRHKLVCAIYNERATLITQSVGGVGSLDEKVSTALISGRPIITFDNFRGKMDSTILETAIRGHGRVQCRSLRSCAEIDCSPFLWQLTTNGAELTRDLANRSVITRIRKRPEDHEWAAFPEGNIEAHVRAHQPRYLGAVHAVIREWNAAGRPQTRETRHDFRDWCQPMDWIVQNIFGLSPLLDGHREEQLRAANPKLQFLRDVINGILRDGYQGHALTATDMADAAEEHDCHFPGKATSEALEVRVGKMLGRLYKDSNGAPLIVDGLNFSRVVEMEYDPIRKEHRERKHYVIEQPGQIGAAVAEPPEEAPGLPGF